MDLPILKSNLKQAIKEAICIIGIATFLGLTVNLFHPKSIKITNKRSSLNFVPDTIIAQDLPGVSFTIDSVNDFEKENSIERPLFIKTAEVLQLITNNHALLLDARSKEEFLTVHIPGAESLPYKNLSEYKTKFDSLPKNLWLICYDDEPSYALAELLAYELIRQGYKLVAICTDGLTGWKQSGHELTGKDSRKYAK